MPQAHLLVPKSNAQGQLEKQIDEGRQLRETRITNQQELEEAKRRRKVFTDYNQAMLMALLEENGNRFKLWSLKYDPLNPGSNPDFEDDQSFFRQTVEGQVTALEGILRSLEHFPERPAVGHAAGTAMASAPKRDFELPERISASWLWRVTPIHFWLWFAGLILTAVTIGIGIGQIPWVHERLSGKTNPPSNQQQQIAKGTISGLIMDQDGKPLIGSSVTVVDLESGRTVYESNTDLNGSYSTPAIPPNRYDISFTRENYGRVSKIVTVEASTNLVINVNSKQDRYNGR